MGRCCYCGKKGLFLNINQFNLCKFCSQSVLVSLTNDKRILDDCIKICVDSLHLDTIISRANLGLDNIERIKDLYVNKGVKVPIDLEKYKVSFLKVINEYNNPDPFVNQEKLTEHRIKYQSSSVSLHFLYNSLIEIYYKQRDDDRYLNRCIELCKADIELFPSYIKQISNITIPFIPSFKQLTIIYEKMGKYEEAIEICKLALRNKLDDKASGYYVRLEKLQNKLIKTIKK